MLKTPGVMNLGTMLAHANTVTNQVLEIEVGMVISDPQVRTVFNPQSIRELADSLLIEGQQTPIIVSPMREGKYTIQKGERRWRAAKLAGITHVKAIVNDPAEDVVALIAGQLIENIQREDLTPMEIAVGVGKLHDAGLSNGQIADRLGKSAAFVSQHLGLLGLPELALELYESGVVTDADSLNSLRKMYDTDLETFELFCAQAKERGSANRADCREAFQEAKRAKVAKEQGYIPIENNPSEELYDAPAGKVIQFGRADAASSELEQADDVDESVQQQPSSAAMSGQDEPAAPSPARQEKPAADKSAKSETKAGEGEAKVQQQAVASTAKAVSTTLVISCEIDMDGEKVRATLAVDRLSEKPGHALLYADIGELDVPFEDVRIVGMEAR